MAENFIFSVMQSFGFTNVDSITIPVNGFADKIFDFLELTIFVREERLRSASYVKNNLEVDEIDTRFLSTCHTTTFPWPGNEVACNSQWSFKMVTPSMKPRISPI